MSRIPHPLMKVPLLDLRAQHAEIESEIKQAVNDVIDSGQYIMGPIVERFEQAVACHLGVEHAIGVSSGTDALLIALMGLDIGPGDLVLTSDYSFFATAGTVSRLKATPVFLDIDPATYNLDPQAVGDWLDREKQARQRVKALLPVHLFGQCADMDPILSMAEEYGIPVIEDAAQAIGACYRSSRGERPAGSMGRMGCFSFFPSKNLGALGDAGLVVTNDAELADKLRLLRNHGARPKYHHSLIGGNFRLDAIQAAVLEVKLRHLEKWHRGRAARAAYYDRHLQVEGVSKPVAAPYTARHIYNQYVIRVPHSRDELALHLTGCGIGHAIYYPVPFHRQDCFSDLAADASRLRRSQAAADHTIALPVYPELTDPMQDYVIETISEFYR